MENQQLTRQEMFNRAVSGLAGQRWEKSVNKNGFCVYMSPDGKRCAWGHVDMSLLGDVEGSVNSLRYQGIGLAALLDASDVNFAVGLQVTHDVNNEPAQMRRGFVALASEYQLEWPSDVPKEGPL